MFNTQQTQGYTPEQLLQFANLQQQAQQLNQFNSQQNLGLIQQSTPNQVAASPLAGLTQQ